MPQAIKKADPELLLESIAKAALAGKPIASAAKQHISAANAHLLQQATGKTIEEWKDTIREELMGASQEMILEIRQAIKEKKFKPGELGYTFAVLMDKLTALEGRNATVNSQVNLTVNQYGTDPDAKRKLIAAIHGNTLELMSPPEPLLAQGSP